MAKINSVVDEDGWFHTKDLGELDENHQLVVKGRIDNMFISGGENIHPENIERAMVQAFDIRQVVVVPKPDSEFGARPIAFVQGNSTGRLADHFADLTQRIRNSSRGTRLGPTNIQESIKINRKYFQGLV